MTLVDMLADQVSQLLRSSARVLVAIDGPDAAGKTTLADALAQGLRAPVVRASLDGFHNPRDIRMSRGELSAEGYYLDSFDYPTLARGLLDPFASGRPTVITSAFDWRKESPVEPDPTAVAANAVLVLDGVFLLRQELRDRWDMSVYLHVTPEETLRRAAVRDRHRLGPPHVLEQRYVQRYIPGQALYRADADPQAFADFVIDNSHPSAPKTVKHPRS